MVYILQSVSRVGGEDDLTARSADGDDGTNLTFGYEQRVCSENVPGTVVSSCFQTRTP